jgi:hypothetical protein
VYLYSFKFGLHQRSGHNCFSFTYRKEKKIRLHHSTTLFTTAESKKSLAKSHAAAIEKLPAEWLFYEEMSR